MFNFIRGNILSNIRKGYLPALLVAVLIIQASSQTQQNKIRIGNFTKCEVVVTKGSLGMPQAPKDTVITSGSALQIPIKAEFDNISFKGTLEIQFPQKTSLGTWTKGPSRITLEQPLSSKVILTGTLDCFSSPATVYYTVNAFTAASTADQACPKSGEYVNGSVNKGSTGNVTASGSCSFSIFDITAPNYDFMSMSKIFYTGCGFELTTANYRVTFSVSARMTYSFDRAGPMIGVSSSDITFNSPPKGPLQVQKIKLSNAGTGQFDYTIAVSTSSGGSWLSVTPTSGSLSESQSNDIEVTVNPTQLTNTGDYKGQLTITSATATNSPVTIPVTLRIVENKLSFVFDPPLIKCGEWTTLNISIVDKDNKVVTDFDGGADVKILKDLSTDKITRMDEYQSVLISKGKAQPIFIYTPKEPYNKDSAITNRTVLSGELFIEVKPENTAVKKDTAVLTIFSPIDFYIDRLEMQQGVKDADKEVQLEYKPGVTFTYPARDFIADHFTIIRANVKYRKTVEIPFSKMEYGLKGNLEVFRGSEKPQFFKMGVNEAGTQPNFQVKDTFSIKEQAQLKDELFYIFDHIIFDKSGNYLFEVSLDLDNLDQVEEEKDNNKKKCSYFFSVSKSLKILGLLGYLEGESPKSPNKYLVEHIRRSYPIEHNKLIINDLNQTKYGFKKESQNMSQAAYWETLFYVLARFNQDLPADKQYMNILCLATESLIKNFADKASGVAYGKACVIVNNNDAPQTASHEVGHLLGLKDTYKASLFYSEPDADQLYNGDPNPRRFNANDNGNWIEEGNINLFSGEQTIGSFRNHDLMSRKEYPINEWIDRVTWDHLYKKIVLTLDKSATINRVDARGYLAVSGSIDKKDNVTLNPLVRMTSVPSVDDTLKGNYTIAFYDKEDKKLSAFNFNVIFFIPDVSETNFVPFSYILPFPDNSKKMRILKQIAEDNQKILMEKVFSDNIPVVRMISPKSGQQLSGNTDIEWTATDPDGDELTYDLVFSPDGNSKQVIATKLRGTTFNWNSYLSENCTNGTLTVIANDGLNDGYAKSDSLKINHITGMTLFTGSGYELEQNSPNPFSETTTIGFTLAAYGHVVMKVCDIYGREIATLLDRKLPEGRHTITWNPERIPSGIYFYQLRSGDFAGTKKLLFRSAK